MQTSRLKKGDQVIVRDASDQAVLLKVWRVKAEVALVASREQFKLLTAGRANLVPVPVPREDIYQYNEGLPKEGPVDWSKMKRAWG